MYKLKTNWKFEKYLSSGGTSHVFQGKYNGIPVAIKWMGKIKGKKEYDNIQYLKNCKRNHLLLPIDTLYDAFYLDDIINNKDQLGKVLTQLRLAIGPKVIKKKSSKKYAIKGDLMSYILILPLMEDNVENIDYNGDEVEKQIMIAMYELKKYGVIHNDIALRNIFYIKDKNGKNKYLLGDFGELKFKKDDAF